jgi:AcrR family transcriptional regulator
VSVRAVAEAVGVTPPSIYRHFADKAELIFEVCARHFTALEDYIMGTTAGIEDPVERLAGLGKAYIEFGVANPEPYRIMFMTRPDVRPRSSRAGPGRSAAFDYLMECVQACIDAGAFGPSSTTPTACPSASGPGSTASRRCWSPSPPCPGPRTPASSRSTPMSACEA